MMCMHFILYQKYPQPNLFQKIFTAKKCADLCGATPGPKTRSTPLRSKHAMWPSLSSSTSQRCHTQHSKVCLMGFTRKDCSGTGKEISLRSSQISQSQNHFTSEKNLKYFCLASRKG